MYLLVIMGSIIRGVLAKILAIIDKSDNYSVLMHWIFLKHVLEGVNDRGHWLIHLWNSTPEVHKYSKYNREVNCVTA